MPNVTFNNIVSSSGGTGNFVATAISTNFNNVSATAATFDSINYSGSAIVSSNISSAAILSQHIGNDAVLSNHISAGAVVNTHLNFASSDSGVRVVQCGSSTPAGGVHIARYTKEWELTLAGTGPFSATLAASFSDAVEGDPKFTANPVFLAQPLMALGLAATHAPLYIALTALNSVSCAFVASWQPQGVTATYTFHFHVAGAI